MCPQDLAINKEVPLLILRKSPLSFKEKVFSKCRASYVPGSTAVEQPIPILPLLACLIGLSYGTRKSSLLTGSKPEDSLFYTVFKNNKGNSYLARFSDFHK